MKRRAVGGSMPESMAFDNQSSLSDERKADFAATLRALNSQFASWVSSQAEEHAGALWVSGVEDYLKHARGLLSEFGLVVAAAASAGESPPARIAAEVVRQPAGFGSTAVNGSIGFGPPAATLGSAMFPPFKPLGTGSSGFGAAPASLFGVPAAAGGATSALDWGASPASQPAAGGLFSFSTASTAAAPPQGDGEEDTDADKVFKSEVVIQESDTESILFKNRCRLHFQKPVDKSWDDRGNGTLTLRQPKAGAGGGSPYIVFTMESGRVLLNARLYKGMRVNQQVGRKVMMVLPVGGEGGENLTLFILPTAEKGDEFTALCLEQSPK